MTRRKPVPRNACLSCKHFNTAANEGRNIKADFGECRRYPPTIGTDGDGDTFYFWPVIHSDEWCGEFHQRLDA